MTRCELWFTLKNFLARAVFLQTAKYQVVKQVIGFVFEVAAVKKKNNNLPFQLIKNLLNFHRNIALS